MQCMKYILSMKTEIIIARAGNKRGCYLTVYIAFCDYITQLKLHALPHANTSEGFTIQYMKTIIQKMNQLLY